MRCPSSIIMNFHRNYNHKENSKHLNNHHNAPCSHAMRFNIRSFNFKNEGSTNTFQTDINFDFWRSSHEQQLSSLVFMYCIYNSIIPYSLLSFFPFSSLHFWSVQRIWFRLEGRVGKPLTNQVICPLEFQFMIPQYQLLIPKLLCNIKNYPLMSPLLNPNVSQSTFFSDIFKSMRPNSTALQNWQTVLDTLIFKYFGVLKSKHNNSFYTE